VIWRVAHGREIPLGRPVILGVLNVTPDSFSDGGRYLSANAALERAEEILAEGGDVIDVGGESTRPGAAEVDASTEADRVLPVIEGIARRWPEATISVDTVKAEVAARAIDAGAHIVNDVSAFRIDPDMGQICASRQAGVVLMHSRGTVADMASHVRAEYGSDTMAAVTAELEERVRTATGQGIAREAIALDPGLGFSKRTGDSIAVLRELSRLVAMGFPVLVGASRKRFIGEVTGEPDPLRRGAGTIAAHVAALMAGARIFRVHDVAPHRQALDLAAAISGSGG
jgi:dihydropteroate synthase